MDTEKLTLATALNSDIERLKKQINFWEKSRKLRSTMQLDVEGFEQYIEVDTTFVNFEVLRALTLSELKKELLKKETEFNNL